MNMKKRVVTTFAVMALGGALGAFVVSRLPGELKGRVSDTTKVCMVTDKVFTRAQMPVIVSGKTYYGCCACCVGRLNTDRKARVAADPVSGRDVDKSEAVILEGESGEALYFESEETARRYRGQAS
jgi:YHS domain-containing protein